MANDKGSIVTPLQKVRGLGAAKDGTGHFVAQRVTAIALVFLVIWFVWAVVVHAGADYSVARAFLGHPVNATLMLLLVLTGLYHLMVGLQVVIEDYSSNVTRVVLLLLNRFACAALAAVSVIAILKLAV